MGPFMLPLGLLSTGFWLLTRDAGKPLFGDGPQAAPVNLQQFIEYKVGGPNLVVQQFRPQVRNAILNGLAGKALAAIPVDGHPGVVVYQLVPLAQGLPSAMQIVSTAQAKGLAVLGSLTLGDPNAVQYLLFAVPAQFAGLAGQSSAFAVLLGQSQVKAKAAPVPAPAHASIAVPPELHAELEAILKDDEADPEALRRMAGVMTEAGHAELSAVLTQRASGLELRRKMRAAAAPPAAEKAKEPKGKKANGAAHALPVETDVVDAPAAEKQA